MLERTWCTGQERTVESGNDATIDSGKPESATTQTNRMSATPRVYRSVRTCSQNCAPSVC